MEGNEKGKVEDKERKVEKHFPPALLTSGKEKVKSAAGDKGEGGEIKGHGNQGRYGGEPGKT